MNYLDVAASNAGIHVVDRLRFSEEITHRLHIAGIYEWMAAPARRGIPLLTVDMYWLLRDYRNKRLSS